MVGRLTDMRTKITCGLPILFLRAHGHAKLNLFRHLHLTLQQQQQQQPQQASIPPPEGATHANVLERVAHLSPKSVQGRDAGTLRQLSELLSHDPVIAKEAWDVKGVVPTLVGLQSCGIRDIEEEARHSLSLLGYAPPYSGRGLRILSVDGGGTRGLIPIIILKHIERLCGQPVHQLFDFVCGTSTGSVLAALLCLERLSAETCENSYRNFSSEVFRRNNLLGISHFVWSHAFYDAKLLEKVIRSYGSASYAIHETSMHAGTPRMCFVSTVANQPIVEPFLFCNYQHHPSRSKEVVHYQRTHSVQCWEALMASTAAPGFFEEVKLGKHIFLDGGILTNNPCGVAIHEARLLWGRATPIQTIVSLGTGLYTKMNEQETASKELTSTSLKEKIIKVVAGATDTETVHTILKDVFDSSVYFRLQTELSEDIPIDESKPEKLALLCEDARNFISSHEGRLEQAVSSLMAEKKMQQKAQFWFNSNWNRFFGKKYPNLVSVLSGIKNVIQIHQQSI